METAAPAFEFTLQFAAGVGQIDPAAGKLRGVTVAEVGAAVGHFAYLDAAGKVVGVGGIADARDFPTAKRSVPLAMDAASLATVVAAAKPIARVKTREDHDDAIRSRAGYAENFRIEAGKAVCDLTILDAYANRAIFLETAQKTPELIGLSGDFKFTAEIVGDQALMRVTRVDAVDIVDRGAVTHHGLFSVKSQPASGVDTPGSEKSARMAAAPNTADDEMAAPDWEAFKALCAGVAAYQAKHAECAAVIKECMSAIQPVPVPTPPGALAPANATNTMTAEAQLALKKEITTELSTSLAAIVATETAKAVQAASVEFRKELSALGLKPAVVPAPAAPATPATPELPADAPKTFLELKASIAKERKVSPAKAAEAAMRENPAFYAAHLRSKGIITEAQYSAQLAARR